MEVKQPEAKPVLQSRVEVVRSKTFQGRVLLLTPDPQNLSCRMGLVGEALSALGCQVDYLNSLNASAERPEVVIFSNPHSAPDLMESLAFCTANKIPSILDLDTDFEQMPHNHPLYANIGLGQPAIARAYTVALLLANHITVPTRSLATSLSLAGYPSRVIADGWSRHNPLWEKAAPRHHTLNLGWMGTHGSIDDLMQIRRIIIRIDRRSWQH